MACRSSNETVRILPLASVNSPARKPSIGPIVSGREVAKVWARLSKVLVMAPIPTCRAGQGPDIAVIAVLRIGSQRGLFDFQSESKGIHDGVDGPFPKINTGNRLCIPYDFTRDRGVQGKILERKRLTLVAELDALNVSAGCAARIIVHKAFAPEPDTSSTLCGHRYGLEQYVPHALGMDIPLCDSSQYLVDHTGVSGDLIGWSSNSIKSPALQRGGQCRGKG